MSDLDPIKAFIVKVWIIALEGKEKALRQFIYNNDARFKADIIQKQIEALEKFLEEEVPDA